MTNCFFLPIASTSRKMKIIVVGNVAKSIPPDGRIVITRRDGFMVIAKNLWLARRKIGSTRGHLL